MSFWDNVQIPQGDPGAGANNPAPTPSPTPTVSNGSKFWDAIPTPKVQAPSSPYWATTTPKGSFGPSPQLDSEGKPFLDYRQPGDTSTTTDRTRVDTTFDPTVPAKIPASSFQNKRDPSIQGKVPGSELDHQQPLELSGSNDPANLKYEPDIAGTKNTATDPIENQLAQDVATGKKSLFQAQTEMAKIKGMKAPFTGANKSVLGQSFFDKVKGFLEGGVLQPKTASADTKSAPTNANDLKKNVLNTIPLTQAAQDIVNKNTNFSYNDDLGSDKPISARTEIKGGLRPLGDKNYVTNIQVGTSSNPADVSHEVFHALFVRSTINPNTFNKQWEVAKKSNPDMQQIDDRLNDPKNSAAFNNNSGESMKDPYSLATERFAFMGSLWGNDGISSLPKNLQGFYKPFLADPAKAPETTTDQSGKSFWDTMPNQTGVPFQRPDQKSAISQALNPNIGNIAGPVDTNNSETSPKVSPFQDQDVKIPFVQKNFKAPGGPVIGGAIKMAAELPERITQEVADTLNTIFNGGIKDNAVFQKGNQKVSDSFSEAAQLSKTMEENGASKAHSLAVGTLYGVSGLILDFAPLVSGAAKLTLAATKFNPNLEGALGRLGLADNFNVEDWANNTRTAASNLAKEGDEEGMQQLVNDYKVIAENLKSGTPRATGSLKFIQNIAAHIAPPSGPVSDVTYNLIDSDKGLPSGETPSPSSEVKPMTPEELSTEINNKVQSFKNLASPDQAGDTIYSNPETKTIQPKEAETIVNDISTDLERANPGSSKGFIKAVDTNNATIDDIQNAANNAAKTQLTPYKDDGALSTSILSKLGGRSSVSKQFISDLTNSPELKQAERDTVRTALASYPDNKPIPVADFANKVKADLLPLERTNIGTKGGLEPRYENISLPKDLRGKIENYSEHVYQSPIKTSAANTHFGGRGVDNYFGHTRVEDIPGSTRRVIEVQSDLYQKGNLERELAKNNKEIFPGSNKTYGDEKLPSGKTVRESENRLNQYNDPTAHFRMVREEIKQAAIDGKTKLQFPTGETAMKIEGLGLNTLWVDPNNPAIRLQPNDLKVGKEISESTDQGGHDALTGNWIITDVLGDGKFKAIVKDNLMATKPTTGVSAKIDTPFGVRYFRPGEGEQFDISGKVDTNNPIHKFYEKDLGKYLKNKYGATTITDKQGVTWNEVNVPKEAATKPVTAFKKKIFSNLEGPKLSPDKIKKAIYATGIAARDINIVFSPKFVEGYGGLGSYQEGYLDATKGWVKPLIKLYTEGGYAGLHTGLHEAGHHLFSQLTPEERVAALNVAKAEMTPLDRAKYFINGYSKHEALEEYLMDKFADEGLKEAGYEKSPFKKFYDAVNRILKKIIDVYKKVKASLDAIPNKQGGFIKNPLASEEGGEIVPDRAETNKGSTDLDKERAKESAKAPTPLEKQLTQLQTEKANLEETVNAHPAKPLAKYANQNGELPEALGEGAGIFGKTGDQIVTEHGFKDSEEARLAYQDYKLKQKRLDISRSDIANTKAQIAKANLEDRDAKSLGSLLNRAATKTDIDIARQARIEALKKAENETQEKLKAETAKKQTLQNKIDQAKFEAQKSKGVVGKIKQVLYPSQALDKVSQPIISDWFQGIINAKQAGLEAFNEAVPKGPQNFQEIVDFQAGKQTPYIREAFDEMGTDFKRRGLSFGWKDNYMPDVWKNSPKTVLEAQKAFLKEKGMSDKEITEYLEGQPLKESTALRLKLRPNFAKDRFWPDYVTGMAHGLKPKYTIPADLIGYYKEAGERALNSKKLIDTLKQEARLLPSDEAPDTWRPVTLRFSREGLYAPPALADLINGKFRDEDNLTLYETAAKGVAAVSRVLQDLVVSGGIPGTILHPFGYAQAYRLATTMIGDVASLQFKSALTSLKASFALIRSNSNTLSVKWFKSKEGVIAMMAKNGIDLTDRVGGRNYKNLYNSIKYAISDQTGLSGKFKSAAGVTKVIFHKAIPEKAFSSLMPQIKVTIFEGAYKAALAKGLSDAEAQKIAADTTRAAEGITKETGRSNTTKQTLGSILFAPPYREGLVNIFVNAGKGFSTEFTNPAYARNRSFLIGIGVAYLAYNLINHKLNGHYMWQNPAGRELALRIPLADGNILYTDLGPSLLTVPRNVIEGLGALTKGDTSTAKQKFGSVFSMPFQLVTELWANQDYFGNPIWKKTDDGKTVITKIAAFLGLETSQPYVKAAYQYLTKKVNGMAALIGLLSLPVKPTTTDAESKAKFYDNIAAKTKTEADAKAKLMPTYQKLQALKNNGQVDEANSQYDALSDNDKGVYDSIKRSETLKDTKAREVKMQTVYDNLQQMKAEGRTDEANAVYFGLSPEDQHAYDLIRNKSSN